MSDFLVVVVPVALIGAIAGVVGGMLGVGGGIVLVPAFFYVFSWLGFPEEGLMQICVGTSMATIVVTSIRSVQGHNRKGTVDWDTLKTWGPWLAISAAAGVYFVGRVSSLTLQVIFGLLAGVAGLWMALGSDRARISDEMPRGATRSLIASVVGFLSATMGIGGGTFGVPLMTMFAMPIHRAVGTASGFGLLISVPAVIGFLLTPVPSAPPYSIGAVNLPAFLVVIGTTLMTTPYGVQLAHRMNPRPLKRVFAVFLAIVALNMLRQALF